MLHKAIELFPQDDVTKHVMLLSDAMPTVGDDPEGLTLKAVSEARAQGITVSLIGVNLEAKGKKFAEELVRLGEGRLYLVRNLGELDQIVLEDYYSVA